MNIEMERGQFIRKLHELGLDDKQISIIKEEFEAGDGTLNGERLVELLDRFGYSRSSVISFLRRLGVEEKTLIKLFSLAKMREDRIVDVVVGDEDGQEKNSS